MADADSVTNVNELRHDGSIVRSAWLNRTIGENGNSTNATNYHRNEDLAKVEIAVQAVILTLAVSGNAIVLMVLAARKRKLSRMNVLIVHLSLADLFVAFFNVLPQLIWDITFFFYGNDFLCRFVKYTQVLGMYASSYVLVTTAIDRYLAICRPLTSHVMTNARIHLLVAVAWALSAFFSIPQVFIFRYRQVAPGSYNCWANFDPVWTLQLYITWFTLAVYVVPLVILVLSYSWICYTVWQSTMSKEPSIRFLGKTSARYAKNGACRDEGSSRLYKRVPVVDAKGRHHLNPRAHTRGRSITKSKIKTVKLTLTVIICYLLCWGPFFVSQMWAAWDANAPFEDEGMVIILLLASLNSCTNPWIYMAFSDNLCIQIVKCFGRKSQSKLQRGYTWNSNTHCRSSMTSRMTEISRFDSVYKQSQISAQAELPDPDMIMETAN